MIGIFLVHFLRDLEKRIHFKSLNHKGFNLS